MSKHILTNLGGQQETRFRGENHTGYLDVEMFNKKFAPAYIDVDPMMVEDFQRTVIKDYGPDQPTFESEKPRRNYDKKINLRSGARTLTDPWANPEFNISDTTKDPRGYLNEIPWKEMRRHHETRIPYTNFGDDSDNSVTSGGIHPNDLYTRIAATRNWLKARLKIFNTSKTTYQSGGIGVLRYGGQKMVHGAPAVTHAAENDKMERRAFEEAGKQNKTIIASNNFHMGSKYFRSNKTTDHEIKVSSYGKLLRNKGLLPHRAQIKDVGHDLNKSMRRERGINKGLLSYITANKAADTSRETNPYSLNSKRGNNKSLKRDIMSLLGLTDAEIKTIRRDANKNRIGAIKCMANIAEITEALEQMSHNEMMQLKSQLMRGAKFDSNIYKNRSHQKLNPAIVLALKDRARGVKRVKGHRAAGDMINGNPDNVLKDMRRKLYAPKKNDPVDPESGAVLIADEMDRPDEKKIHSYKSIKPQNIVNNTKSSIVNVEHNDLEKIKNKIRSVRKYKHGVSETIEDQDREDNKFFNYGLVSWNESTNNKYKFE